MSAKRFCLVSPGRAGSTSLMRAFSAHRDIAVPGGNGELLNPRLRKEFADFVARKTGLAPDSPHALLEQFFAAGESAAYAGFKLIPLQYHEFDGLLQRTDIQFIVLTRKDLPSLVASWFIAKRFDTFRLGSRAVVKQITFGSEWQADLRRHIKTIVGNLDRIGRISGAIRVEYEDMCKPAFACTDLDSYFGRRIVLRDPRPATDARDYVRDWENFSQFVLTEVEHARSVVSLAARSA